MNNKEAAEFMGLADKWRNEADQLDKDYYKAYLTCCKSEHLSNRRDFLREAADELDRTLAESTKEHGIQIVK